eukprot:4005825-Karenia_brevis.AAC.1
MAAGSATTRVDPHNQPQLGHIGVRAGCAGAANTTHVDDQENQLQLGHASVQSRGALATSTATN